MNWLNVWDTHMFVCLPMSVSQAPTNAPTPTPLYPKLTVASAVSSSSSITATVLLSLDGSVYCAALPGTRTAATGQEIKAFGFGGVAVGGTFRNVTITGLTALTSYKVFCYT